MSNTTLHQCVFTAAGRIEVIEAVDAVYAALQTEIDQRRPRCDLSGRCCHFEAFGHRLYVTTIELAAFVASNKVAAEPNPGSCPFQRGKLCAAHTSRPFGCRIFFCDPTADEWQREKYEQFHGELKRLHDTLAVPYYYVEWRAALSDLEMMAV